MHSERTYARNGAPEGSKEYHSSYRKTKQGQRTASQGIECSQEGGCWSESMHPENRRSRREPDGTNDKVEQWTRSQMQKR